MPAITPWTMVFVSHSLRHAKGTVLRRKQGLLFKSEGSVRQNCPNKLCRRPESEDFNGGQAIEHTGIVDLATAGIDRFQKLIYLLITHFLA